MIHDPKKPYAIGIDLGGTAIKGGLLDDAGVVVHKEHIPTEADEGPDHVLDRIASLIDTLRSVAAEKDLTLAGVGVGAPGILSHRRGVVIAPPNLKGWHNVPVVERLAERSGLKVVLENDANAAALGEYLCGAGAGVRDMVMLTIGTGIGSGIIIDGRLFRGALENAGELGHAIVCPAGRLCNCGQRGCLEAHASAHNTAVHATERITAGEASVLKAVLDRGDPIDAQLVAQAAAEGDALARSVWMDTCRFLAIGCINIQRAFCPERIVLAGGMSDAGEQLRGPIVECLAEIASKTLGPLPEITIARLGNDAGFVGAALVFFHGD